LQEKDDVAWYKFEVRRYRPQQKTGAVLGDLWASKPMLPWGKKSGWSFDDTQTLSYITRYHANFKIC